MQYLRSLLARVPLPIELPASAFMVFEGQERLYNFLAIVHALPEEVREHVDREVTINNVGRTGFAVPLKNGNYILARLTGRQITSLEIISHH